MQKVALYKVEKTGDWNFIGFYSNDAEALTAAKDGGDYVIVPVQVITKK